MEVVKVSEILDLVKKIHKDAQMVIHFLEGRTLVGEINRPANLVDKKPRKKRVPKVKVEDFPPPVDPSEGTKGIEDSDHPFYGKKRERKKKESDIDMPADE